MASYVTEQPAAAAAATPSLPADSWAARMQAEAAEVSGRRRELAAQLVRSELRIWEAAQAWLAEGGGEQRKGGVAKRKR